MLQSGMKVIEIFVTINTEDDHELSYDSTPTVYQYSPKWP